MKKILTGLIGICFALAVYAQGTVTINVSGNRNKQIVVDGTTYTVQPTTTTGTRQPIIITGLAAGQHTLEVINDATQSNTDENISTIFKTRSGYDLQITVRNNGAVQLKEMRATATSGNMHPAQYKTPMSSSSFNSLLQSVKRQNRANAKLYLVNNAIINNNNYFTTAQIELLVLQINAQNSRLSLLKTVYPRTTDPENFENLYDLLTSQAHKQNLASHVSAYNYNYGTVSSSSSHNAYVNPMTNASYNTIYSTAQNQGNSILRVNYIVDVFANTNNYFTSNQARQLIQLVPEENNRLILAKTAYRGVTDASNFYLVSNLLSSSSARNDLAAYVNSYTSGTTYTSRLPMSASSFSTLYDDISRTWGLGAKLNELRDVFANTANYFTTAQAKQLIQLVSAEANRLELAKAAYRTITDPANFSQVYDVLSSQSSRNELSAYVNSYSPGTTYESPVVVRTGMSESSYNSLYSSVKNTWGLGAKMNSLTNIFANTSYYFTTAQAKQLIELVSSESNRLQLAKAAYARIVDPDLYFTQVSQVLSSQSSRTELENYIRSN